MNILLIILSIYFICCKLISIVYHQSTTSKTNNTNKTKKRTKTKQNKQKTKQKQKQKQTKKTKTKTNVGHFPVNINQWYKKGPPTNILLNCSNNLFCLIMTQY